MSRTATPMQLLTPAPRTRLENEDVHPLLSMGFRPFFLLATLTAVIWVPLWLHLLAGGKATGHLPPFALHAHEMLFGFASAVIAGFLLTAGSNWTGRRTATGNVLASLCLLWLAGRVAILAPGIPFWLVRFIDLSFFPALAFVLTVPIVASKNYRNLPFLVMLLLLFVANSLMYAEQAAALEGVSPWFRSGLGQTIALRVITLMMLVMGGRVIPLFTRNATHKQHLAANPLTDRISLAWFAIVAILAETGLSSAIVAALWLGCGAAHFYRMKTWGTRYASAPLLWILHLGYASLALSFALEGAAHAAWVPQSAATHALTVGGIGGLCLGMMTRVSLGHSGRMLVAPHTMTVAFGLLATAALVRVAGPVFTPSALLLSYQLSGALWTVAFTLLLLFGLPIWLKPRVDAKPESLS